MDYKDITALLIKVAGAVIVTFTVANIPAFLSYYYSSTDRSFVSFLTATAFPFLAPLIAGMVFILLPATVSNKIVRGEKIDTSGAFLSQLEAIAIAVLGIYLLFRAIVDSVYHIVRVIKFYQLSAEHLLPSQFEFWSPDMVANSLATGVEIALSLWFILGARGLAKTLRRLRSREP